MNNQLKAAVTAHIFHDVSDQIQREFKAKSSIARDIEDIITMASDEGDDLVIYQWWIVSNEFARAAVEHEEFILNGLPFGTLWGRQTCGQALECDVNVQDILKSIDAAI